MELCADCAVLSSEAAKRGFQTFAFDHKLNRFSPKAKIFQLDLAKAESGQLLSDMYHHMKPQWTQMGLPCGTASRVREKPVSNKLRAEGAPQPRPLRDQDNLMSLADLSPAEQRRVDGANQVYQAAEGILFIIFMLGLWVSIENPDRSWLWTILALLVKRRNDDEYSQWYFTLSDTTFDACQHGNNFAKTTTLKGTSGIFEHLGGHCDGSHAHANWKVQRLEPQWIFNTAAEAEYPRLLAERMVAAVMTKLPQHLFQQTILRFRLDLLQQADKQHKLGEQLIPEYCKVSFRDEPPLTGSLKILAQPFNQTGEDNDKGCAAKGSHESNRYKIGFHFSWRCKIWHLLVHKFGFLTSVFYDDYRVF